MKQFHAISCDSACKLADYSSKLTAVNLDRGNERLYNSCITGALRSLSTIVPAIPTAINDTRRISRDVFRSGAQTERQMENFAGAYHETPIRDTRRTRDKIAAMNSKKSRSEGRRRERIKGSGKVKHEKIKRCKEPPGDTERTAKKKRERKKSGTRKERERQRRNERDRSAKFANLLTIVWYVLAVRQDCRRRGWKSTSDPPRKRLTPIPVLIAQTCFSIPSAFTYTHGWRAGASAGKGGGLNVGYGSGWRVAGGPMKG